MTEDFLHFIWKFGLFHRENLKADTGESVEIITLGDYNIHSGPDFLNARIKIGNTIWAGNVEVHLYSSDWILHGHQQDKAYDNVVLHVVGIFDKTITRKNGEPVPTIVLQFESQMYENYRNLTLNKSHFCLEKVKKLDPLLIDVWLNTLMVERLQDKTQNVLDLLKRHHNDWETSFYIKMARSFGFGVNADPFEMLARSIPYTLLLRHRNCLPQIEALLFGQAGFLEEAQIFNDYYGLLRKEYLHLKNKYKLAPLQRHLWKFMRLRPVNFPTIRLAQFASLIIKSEGLFSEILSHTQLSAVKSVVQATASDFWNTHYTFETSSAETPKRLGDESVCNIVINAIIPFVFTRGMVSGSQELKDRALQWMSQLPAENNQISRSWMNIGIHSDSALYSQALIQLNHHYCSDKKCLSCSIGSKIITTFD